jgi:hypothetical protein
MSDNLEEHVDIDVSVAAGGSPREGYGIALLLSHNATFPGRTKSYSGADELAADWADDSPEYLAGSAIFAQDPCPESLLVGRTTTEVTQRYELGAASAVDAQEYVVDVVGEGFEGVTLTHTAAVGSSKSSINAGLLALFNAVTDKTFTAALADLTVEDFDFTADNTTEEFTKVDHGFTLGDGPIRLKTTGTIVCAANAAALDGDYVTIGDNVLPTVTFEYDKATDGVTGGRTAWPVGTTAASNATALKLLIEAAFPALTVTDDLAGTLTIEGSEAGGLVPIVRSGNVTVSVTAGALPTGTLPATDYWPIPVDDDTFELATSLANANTGTNLSISTNGTGVLTAFDTGTTSSASSPIVITADEPGAWFSVAPSSTTLMDVKATHTVSGLGDDLTEILNSDASWYCLLLLYPSKDYITDASAWVASNERVLVTDVNETEALNVDVDDGTDTLAALFELGGSRTMAAYHHAPNEFMSAAWMGRWLPTKPGQATTKYKQLQGVTKSVLSSAQSANLRARRANAFQRVGQVNITWEGTVASLTYKFFDIRRNADWVRDQIMGAVYDLELENDILEYTPEDIQKIGGAIHGVFDLAIRQKVFSPTPKPTVTLPVFEDISVGDKSDRILDNVTGTAKFAGAIHKVRARINLSF